MDLAEEKVYQVNLKDKSYKVVTFAEIRREMEEAARKAEEEARKIGGREAKDQKEMQVDFDVKDTGQTQDHQRRSTAGRSSTTITVHEKGKTLEQAGGIVMTADSWLASDDRRACREVADFDLRYARQAGAGRSTRSR